MLVVAADDGVMPQTLEAIDHAKAANVPIIVAVNKIDKPDAIPERVKKQLADRGLIPEEWGGSSTVFVEVSAKQKTNLDLLLEMICLVSDLQRLEGAPGPQGSGHGAGSQARSRTRRGGHGAGAGRNAAYRRQLHCRQHVRQGARHVRRSRRGAWKPQVHPRRSRCSVWKACRRPAINWSPSPIATRPTASPSTAR